MILAGGVLTGRPHDWGCCPARRWRPARTAGLPAADAAACARSSSPRPRGRAREAELLPLAGCDPPPRPPSSSFSVQSKRFPFLGTVSKRAAGLLSPRHHTARGASVADDGPARSVRWRRRSRQLARATAPAAPPADGASAGPGELFQPAGLTHPCERSPDPAGSAASPLWPRPRRRRHPAVSRLPGWLASVRRLRHDAAGRPAAAAAARRWSLL
jgi:hypothetical protein